MSNKIENPVAPPPEGISWEAELKKIGLLRRFLMGRKWYRVDWWFVVLSSFAVLGFIVVAIFPGLFAPYKPDELVGPRFLAPNEVPTTSVLVVQSDSQIDELLDLAVPEDAERPLVGVVMGDSTAGDLNSQSQLIDDEIKNQPEGLRLRPKINRYASVEELLTSLANEEIQAAVLVSTDFIEVADQYPTLKEVNTLTGELAVTHGFALGTNDIGQDILSRMIWGTRIALIIGFSSALISLFIGVPLGLIAGFAGGGFDRVLSLIMDSLYSFPGLILAIAIAAVLGPSILNIIVAISVLYIPTYYRIVRGQTLTVKEEVYIEAAKSIGAKKSEILWRYIFPNVIPSVAIIFSVNVADAILTGAGLSFLGLGLPPTIADWGIDLARGQRFIQTAWWMITFPGMAIMLVVLSFTLLGEGLTEIFNPKLRDR